MTDAPPTEVFGPLAEDYARFRPVYPEPLFDAIWERLRTERPVALDLAAGAGAATAALVAHGARAVAVEPALAMLGHAPKQLARGWLAGVSARAEALPFADGVADLVTVAQGFHWFEPDEALTEIARVLVSGGALAVFWNIVLPDDFAHDVGDLIGRWNTGYGRPVTNRMRATPGALATHPAFEVDPPLEFLHKRTMEADRYVGYAFSWSYVGGALAPADRAPFERELRALIARHHGETPWQERFAAVLHLARRREEAATLRRPRAG